MLDYAATLRVVLVAAIVTGGVAGCAEYVDRKDTIAFSAGNAVQTNIVTHVTDPWPATSRNKNFATNGQRMQRAVENYRCGRTSVTGSSDNGGGSVTSGESASTGQGSQTPC